MPEETALATFAPATSLALSNALMGLEGEIQAAAQANLNSVLLDDPNYSETEKEAMLVVEELRMVNGLDLAAVLLRNKFLLVIEQRNLVANHPGQYESMQDMARKQGISAAELSQTVDLARVVFPYVQDTLGMPIAQLWEEIGKSNFRELVPVLKSIITGVRSATDTVNDAVTLILDDVAATGLAAGQNLDEAGVRRHAVERLLEAGATLPNRTLRDVVRPTRTAPIHASVIDIDGIRMVIAQVNDEGQWNMLQRRMGASLDTMPVNLPVEARQRQVEAARIPELRALLRLLGG